MTTSILLYAYNELSIDHIIEIDVFTDSNGKDWVYWTCDDMPCFASL